MLWISVSSEATNGITQPNFAKYSGMHRTWNWMS